MSNRTLRVNELIQRELSAILRQHYQSEAVAITLTEVRVSPDLREARVFVSVVGDEPEKEKKLRWLRANARDIRQELGRRIVLKFLPRFEYVLDHSTERATHLLQLLDEVAPPASAEESAAPHEPEEKEES
ncbi:MAG: 30S ribosome-binding factor RbfA [Verrucomicrobia bacterium]|nr:30S ribosome-binding factor RbfA [Verrucomicrobiota bacterium]